ncbi:hypothetical protein M0657_010225 [Pyricularia oryzae]|nr:hypothetical protein M9X92_010230 [Pyricularia oryzae]KAI7912945.1 hypothetical protein M0657_010225 [Pyricularia oryzae]
MTAAMWNQVTRSTVGYPHLAVYQTGKGSQGLTEVGGQDESNYHACENFSNSNHHWGFLVGGQSK